MRKRQRRDSDLPIVSINPTPIHPNAPPDFIPPTPQQFIERLRLLREARKEDRKPDFLTRLKALSSGNSLPVPTSFPKVEVIPESGVAFDSLTKMDLPKSVHKEKDVSVKEVKIEAEKQEKEKISEILMYDQPIGFGLGGALKYLSHHGILKEKSENEPILEYRDEHGFRITGKEVFRHQSHIFSGKRPGEKHRKRDLMRHRAEEMQKMAEIGDTPLHTASALRKTLEERKQAFIELTGENRTVIPYEPEVKKTKRKRLKFKKQE